MPMKHPPSGIERAVAVSLNARARSKFMIFGAHVIVYSKDSTADRAFFRDVLGFSSVDAGHGWLIFELPPQEAAVHPDEGNDRIEPYFLCDDLKAEIWKIGTKGVDGLEVHRVS